MKLENADLGRVEPSPRELRPLANHHFDSTRWEAIRFRPGDIVISNWAKSGTTWLQQIVCQLIFNGAERINVSHISLWVDFRITPLTDVLATLDAQRHRRVMKTHLPADSLPIMPEVQYLYIARQPLDVVWSWYRHHSSFTDEAYLRLNNTPGRQGPPLERPDPDFRTYLRRWLHDDGYPFHPYWSNVRTWWDARHLPNVKLLHFTDLRRALALQVAEIARVLNIVVPSDVWPQILDHCSLPFMKAHAELVTPLGGTIFKDGAAAFIHTGTTGQWRETLTESDRRECLAIAAANLPADCLHWLHNGSQPSDSLS